MDITQYKMTDFVNCMHDLLVTLNGASKHPQQAIQEKYKQSKYVLKVVL
jgi:Cyclin, C-terminal domain